MEAVENMHFSTPHIQNLFDDATRRYYWVISLSRVVDLTDKGTPVPGVLLVDMDTQGNATSNLQLTEVPNATLADAIMGK